MKAGGGRGKVWDGAVGGEGAGEDVGVEVGDLDI